MAHILTNFSNIGVGILISFVYAWPIALLNLAFVPFVVISGMLLSKMLSGLSEKDNKVIEEAGQVYKRKKKHKY